MAEFDVQCQTSFCAPLRTSFEAVSSIYIWSKNFSHSSKQKSEAKYGGNWRSYSTSVPVPCATISLNRIGKCSMFRALFDLESDPDPHPNKNL